MLFFNMEKELGQHVCGSKDEDKLKLRENVAEDLIGAALKLNSSPTNQLLQMAWELRSTLICRIYLAFEHEYCLQES